MVDHSILLTKLEVYRLDPSALAWFRCYLNDRNCSMLHLRVIHPQGPSHIRGTPRLYLRTSFVCDLF